MLTTDYAIDYKQIDKKTLNKITNINKINNKILSRKILKWYRENKQPLHVSFFKLVQLINSNNLTFKISEKNLFKQYLKMLYLNRIRREII